MSGFDSLDISATALYAQRVRMDAISSNIANVNTTRNADGTPGPYVRKQVVFSAIYNDKTQTPQAPSSSINPEYLSSNGGNMMLKGNISFDNARVSDGVTVSELAEDANPFKVVYEPSHPDADKNGFVKMPNINIVTEMVDMMNASRAYEANVNAMEATKGMMNAALRI